MCSVGFCPSQPRARLQRPEDTFPGGRLLPSSQSASAPELGHPRTCSLSFLVAGLRGGIGEGSGCAEQESIRRGRAWLPGGTCFILENKSRKHCVEPSSSSGGAVEASDTSRGRKDILRPESRAWPRRGSKQVAFEVPLQLSPKQRTGGFFNTTHREGYKDRAGEGTTRLARLQQLQRLPCLLSGRLCSQCSPQATPRAPAAGRVPSPQRPPLQAASHWPLLVTCLPLATGAASCSGCLNRSDLPTPEARWPQGVMGADKIQAAK